MPIGPLMLDLEGITLTPEEQTLLRNPLVGGVIFFARNFESREQICELVGEIRAIRPELLLAVDQEGGRVQRFREGFTRLPAMQKLGDLYRGHREEGLAVCFDAGWLMASEVLACGVDFSFAPVLDLDREHCEVIGDRAFSDDPDEMVACAGAFIAGMQSAGMATTAKHFPGHGSVVADSHLETPYDERTMEQVRKHDLIPFKRLAGEYDAVMPAHMVFPNISPDSVGFSPFWLQQILRGELDFDGVIFSDDLSMKGADVAGGYAEKANAALSAGCDMVLVCNDRPGALEVLSYLEGHQLPLSERLPAMAAKGRLDWDKLVASERYQNTRKQLALLV